MMCHDQQAITVMNNNHSAFTWMFVHFMLKTCSATMNDNFPNQNK